MRNKKKTNFYIDQPIMNDKSSFSKKKLVESNKK
jgi:hypothetical protein